MEKVNGGDVMSVTATIEGSPERLLIDIGRIEQRPARTATAPEPRLRSSEGQEARLQVGHIHSRRHFDSCAQAGEEWLR
jgi:hypothetical protein